MDIAVASRIIGGAPVVDTAGTGTLKLTLQAGEAVTIVTCVLSKLDDPDFLEAAKKKVVSLEAKDIPAMTARHRDWWKGFWSKSFIEIPDKEIEKRWYAALYVMGSCSKPGKVAPGLWGCWVTIFAQWQGDYHLNYNFQAPYYIVYSSNHADLSAPFYQAIQESLPRAREMASKHGWKGVHFPVCIGPRGIFPEGEKDHGQRSNAAYVALNFIWQYQYTQDKEFLKTTAYPYLLEVADFWEDYLKLEKGRYVIHNDAIHEGSGENMNPILSLGLVRTLFKNLIVMSQDLGVDKARRARWQDLQDRLSAFPLQERNGKTVFRLTEKGMDWAGGNTLEIQHIFPAGTIGLDSDPKLLQISHNTLSEMNRWTDNNGFSSWYTTCARVGYDPQVILAKLREECDKHSFPNLLLFYGGGGVESCGGFLAVNEMLLQSHEGVLRFFPCWPKDQNARFGTLRAVGAFLVSAELQNGVVSGVKIVSEKGCPCTVQNPWPGKTVKVLRNGKAGKSVKGDRFTLKTEVNEVIELQPPAGTRPDQAVPAGEKTQVPVAGGVPLAGSGSQPVDIVYAKTMPGDASARQKGNAFILSNSALEMGWTLENGHLLLTRIKDKNNDRAYDQHGEIFLVQVDNGTRISSSACELVGAPALEIIKPVSASACAAQHLKGWQLSARFRHPATGLTVQWRAELRDGSHYVRQIVRVEGDKGRLTEVRCLEASVGRAWNEGTAMAGNPVVSDHLFMGQELPMSKNVAPGGGIPDKWTPSDMLSKSINRRIKDLKPGPLSVRFAYERGVFRIDVAEVQLVADGKVVSKDEHAGWSGLSTQANAYALTVPAGVKTAELRVRLGGAPNDTDSFGTMTVSNGVLLPGDPGPVLCGLNCQLPLQAGNGYEFSSVLGTYPEGQLRRAFLRYVERERARSYSQFLHYNCWFDLHINLNEEKILKNVKAFTEEMTVKRGVAMESYVLDDGWDAPREGFWTVDKKKFPSGFDPITAELDRVNSHMGIWISPLAGYAFVGERVGHAGKLGLVREGSFLDLSYTPYYEWFRDFCASLVKKNKVNYFKWDKAGDGASPHFMALLSCARELRQVDPNLFFNVTVGTWPSPFWLNVIDSTWRGGEDVNWDWECKGNDREKWLNYR
jgi:hypothetical protein